ncbi:MAG: hypothetical protein AABZ44_01570 [Elusimicrobiota bacterium]
MVKPQTEEMARQKAEAVVKAKIKRSKASAKTKAKPQPAQPEAAVKPDEPKPEAPDPKDLEIFDGVSLDDLPGMGAVDKK